MEEDSELAVAWLTADIQRSLKDGEIYATGEDVDAIAISFGPTTYLCFTAISMDLHKRGSSGVDRIFCMLGNMVERICEPTLLTDVTSH